MCTWEDIHICLFKRTFLDDVMCQNELTTSIAPSGVLIGVLKYLMTPVLKRTVLDDVMSQNELTTGVF